MAMESGEYLTIKEVAERYHVNANTVWGWVHRGLVKKYKRPLEKRIYLLASEVDALRNAEPQPIEPKESQP